MPSSRCRILTDARWPECPCIRDERCCRLGGRGGRRGRGGRCQCWWVRQYACTRHNSSHHTRPRSTPSSRCRILTDARWPECPCIRNERCCRQRLGGVRGGRGRTGRCQCCWVRQYACTRHNSSHHTRPRSMPSRCGYRWCCWPRQYACARHEVSHHTRPRSNLCSWQA